MRKVPPSEMVREEISQRDPHPLPFEADGVCGGQLRSPGALGVSEMYARGLSTRDVQECFRDEISGELVISRERQYPRSPIDCGRTSAPFANATSPGSRWSSCS
jgi:hypothetical protein